MGREGKGNRLTYPYILETSVFSEYVRWYYLGRGKFPLPPSRKWLLMKESGHELRYNYFKRNRILALITDNINDKFLIDNAYIPQQLVTVHPNRVNADNTHMQIANILNY